MEVRVILTRPNRRLTLTEQLLLVSAARFDRVRSVIRPVLASCQWVVSDRFIDSTYAYQIAVPDTDFLQLFQSTHEIVIGPTIPSLTIVLDLPLEIACKRREERRDRILDPAKATRDFAVIREGLVATARKKVGRCYVFDADQSLDEVAQDIWDLIEPFL